MKRALIVCSEPCPAVEQQLGIAGYEYVEEPSGESAVERVQVEMFDAAIVVSTGRNMDPLETVFNLRDLARSMLILMVRPAAERDLAQEHFFPYIKWCSLSDLALFL